jgi:hypothetical protein
MADTGLTRQELHEQLIAAEAALASSRAANAQGNQGGLNPNPAASAAIFALSPALASQGVFLDLSTSNGTKQAASLATDAPGNQLQGGLPPNQAPRATLFALSPALASAGEFVDIGPPPIAAARAAPFALSPAMASAGKFVSN